MSTYQIAVYVDGIESVSESIVIQWRKDVDRQQAKSKLHDICFSATIFPENTTHVQLRDENGTAISEVWAIEQR